MQEVDGSIPFCGTYPNEFSDQTDQDIRTQCALSWKWRSVNAVSLNVGRASALSNRQRRTCAHKHTTNTKKTDTQRGVCAENVVPYR